MASTSTDPGPAEGFMAPTDDHDVAPVVATTASHGPPVLLEEHPTLTMTPEVIKADAQNRVARTAGQAGGSLGVVIVGEYFAHQFGWHGTMPNDVALSLAGLLTTVASWWTNRSRLKGRA